MLMNKENAAKLSPVEVTVLVKLLNIHRRFRTSHLFAATRENLTSFDTFVILDAIFNPTALRCLTGAECKAITRKTVDTIEGK